MKNLKRISRGFTIIEVMIVLAIAGLILAIVFIAVPQLQRSTRDNQRQNIAARIKSEMENYASNNQGVYPFGTTTNYAGAACGATTTGCILDFVSRYISGGKVNIKDPTSGADVLIGTAANNGRPQACAASGTSCTNTLPSAAGQLVIVYGAKCSGETLATSGSTSLSTRQYIVMIGLDRANTRYCVDNG